MRLCSTANLRLECHARFFAGLSRVMITLAFSMPTVHFSNLGANEAVARRFGLAHAASFTHTRAVSNTLMDALCAHGSQGTDGRPDLSTSVLPGH